MNPLLYTLLALSLLVSGLRAQAQTPPGAAVGAVETLYVRLAPGLFIEATLWRQRHDASWSDVRLQATANGRPRQQLARNPEALEIRKGDIVQMSISPPPELATGPAPEFNRVVARVAAAGTPQARQIAREIAGESPLTVAEALR
jgi:hypothetical protein